MATPESDKAFRYLVDEAGKLGGDSVAGTLKRRQPIYGPPAVNFERIAEVMWAFFGPHSARPLLARKPSPADVGYMQMCIKLGRAMHSPDHLDTIHDLAGYAECIKSIVKRDGP